MSRARGSVDAKTSLVIRPDFVSIRVAQDLFTTCPNFLSDVDRFWFRSLYVREPNGILFEIATDGPGFGIDEDMSTLGEQLVLPPFLEPRREQIIANLKTLD